MAPRFFIGPARWLAADSGLNAHERLVLAVLCQWTSKTTGECFPSVATIAGCAAICENSVRKAIAGLTKHGALRVRHRHTKSGRQLSPMYLVIGFDPPPERGVHPVKGRGSSRGIRPPHGVNPNVVTDNNPLNDGEFIRTDNDGTVWLGQTPYRSR